MTTGNKTTAPEGATSETANELANGSVTTAYLSRRGHNTGYTYGTWSGPLIVSELLEQADAILVEDAEDLLTHLDTQRMEAGQ